MAVVLRTDWSRQGWKQGDQVGWGRWAGGDSSCLDLQNSSSRGLESGQSLDVF